MIGKQVNFFMLPEDERLFLTFVFTNPEVELIIEHNNEPNIQLIDKNAYLLNEIPTRTGVYLLWNKTFPIEGAFIRKVEYREFSEDAMDYVLTGKSGYVVDKINAPVIEYMPSKFIENGIINRGRIWAGMFYSENGKLIRKKKEFETWYDKIARWLRRNFSRTNDSSFFYLGPELIKLHKMGKVRSKPYEAFDPEVGEVLLKA